MELACLQELLKRLQDRHVECAQSVTKKTAADEEGQSSRKNCKQGCSGGGALLKKQWKNWNGNCNQREHALMMMLVMLMICSQNLIIVTWTTTAGRERTCKTVEPFKSGLTTINRTLAQGRTVSCITSVLVWFGGFHSGAAGTLLWQSL
jgi:hypothetical protein